MMNDDRFLWPATVLLSVVIFSGAMWLTFGVTGRYTFIRGDAAIYRCDSTNGEVIVNWAQNGQRKTDTILP